jgi:hypothetical protein
MPIHSSSRGLRLARGRFARRRALLRALAGGLLLLLTGCSSVPTVVEPVAYRPESTTLRPNAQGLKALRPSNDRAWSPDQAVLSVAEFHGNQVTVRNIRNIAYRTADSYDVHHYDKTFDLDRITSIDFIVVPFNDMPGIAHTMLSFGFDDREFLGLSVEIRKEKGESYSPVKGFFRQYELMYVLADERDLILKNSMHWLASVYVYRTRATPEQARAVFVDVLNRANKLAAEPEFYDTLKNNCTTNIRNHINRCFPDRVPFDYRVALPGYSAELAYDLGLLASDAPFETTKSQALVNYAAYLYRDDPQFSVRIRQPASVARAP